MGVSAMRVSEKRIDAVAANIANVGTILYALCIGPLVHWLLPAFTVDLGTGAATSDVPAAEVDHGQ